MYIFIFICEEAMVKICCEVSAQSLALLLLLWMALPSQSHADSRGQLSEAVVWCVPEILNHPPNISHSDDVDFSSSVSASVYVWDLGSYFVIVAIPSPLSLSWYDLLSLVFNNSFSHNKILVSSGQLAKFFLSPTRLWWLMTDMWHGCYVVACRRKNVWILVMADITEKEERMFPVVYTKQQWSQVVN